MKFITLSNLQSVVTKIKATFVAKEAGKGLSANDLSNTLKTNYDAAYTHSQAAHAPSGAQVNIIETVKRNGVALTVTSKAIDISVPTKVSELTNDKSYLTATEAYLKAEVDAKINGLISERV